jgi:predicted GNAT family N-acyltransferase
MICKEAISKKEILQAIFLRRKVLVREFGYSTYKFEPDKYDLYGRIYVVKANKKVIGTVRVRQDGKIYRIQRTAIDKDYRKKGVGSMLLKKVLHSFKDLYLMSPTETVPFYERFGFKKTGEKQKGKHHVYYRMQNY